ncbi:MAG: hypothetical protein LUP94_02690 [Candidatus Methanomethylicus sp.]|nr:hypothetical protein [Candidatus Methanomethylicus sp.]
MTECVYHSGVMAQVDALCKKIQLHMEVVETKISFLEKATAVAASNLDRRLIGMEGAQFATKSDLKEAEEKFNLELKDLMISRAILEGKADQKSVGFAIFIALAGCLVSIASVIIHLVK